MDFIDVSAKTVDEAITKACIELGMSSDRLEIQVISEGSTGFLRFGSKPAVIRVGVKEEEIPVEENPVKEIVEEKAVIEKPVVEEVKEAVDNTPVKKVNTEKNHSEKSSRKNSKKNSKKKNDSERRFEKKNEKKDTSSNIREYVAAVKTDEEIVEIKATAKEFLDGVFKAMELPVEMVMSYDKEAGSLEVTFEGDDMGVLIGKRGQTLDSLQYLVSLVINKNQKDYVRVKLDTEDYRRRRKETLENLAKNIANKVKRTRRPVSIEPMNPYERRIIHSALQGNRYVETYSEGYEPYRHVIVTLKK